jgi:ECF transporter S component (folate family)
MKKMAAVYGDSWQELKHVRTITTVAMFMAVSVILGFFTIEAGPYLKIGFGSVVNEFVYYLFGPVVGAVYGGVLDLVKFVAKPTGAFFPGFTLNAILGGVLYGSILYRRPLSLGRVLAANLAVAVICNICLNTLFLSIMSGKAIIVLLPVRALKNLIMWPVDSFIFLIIARTMENVGLVRAIRRFQ